MTCTYVESPLGAQATVTSSGRWLPFKVRIIQSYADWGALCYLPSLHNTPYLGLVLHIALLQSFFLMGNRWFILWTPTVTVLQLTHSGRQEGRVCSHVKIDFSSVQFSRSVMSLRLHELQHARPPCPSPTPGVHSNSRPSSRWWHSLFPSYSSNFRYLYDVWVQLHRYFLCTYLKSVIQIRL